MEFFADPIVSFEHAPVHLTRRPVEDFPLTVEDSMYGEADYLRRRVSNLVDQADPALGLEELFDRLPSKEVKAEGADAAGQFTRSKTHTWRTLARFAAVKTKVSRKLLLDSKRQAEEITARLLGPCLPHKRTIDRNCDGFRSVAVALGLHLNRLVTPRRAAACFARKNHQGLQLTAYGESLLKRCQKSWPPCPPELASSGVQDPARPLIPPGGPATATPSRLSQLDNLVISESEEQEAAHIVDALISLPSPRPVPPQQSLPFHPGSPFAVNNPIRPPPVTLAHPTNVGVHPSTRTLENSLIDRISSPSLMHFLDECLLDFVPAAELHSASTFTQHNHAFQATVFANEDVLMT